jgi:hypothetical protein
MNGSTATYGALGDVNPVVTPKLLKALAEAHFGISRYDLIRYVWYDCGTIDESHKKNLRTHLTKLRGYLRKSFNLPETVDPILQIKNGTKLLKIDTDVLLYYIKSIKK